MSAGEEEEQGGGGGRGSRGGILEVAKSSGFLCNATKVIAILI
jgi:hypothetical protein